MLETFFVILLIYQTGDALGTSQPGVDGKQPKAEKSPALWAVLVSGARSYFDYANQATVCHAYKILVAHGVPESNIIVMLYDDVAYNRLNPTPGILIDELNGTDVYKGVPKHYTRRDVTQQNFLKLLLGDESLTKKGYKVLQSGPNDHVLIYFADHGSKKVLCFPYDNLYASEFISTVKEMHKRGKYGKMIIYLEACFSGSIFKNILPKDINIYAVTAANEKEFSYRCIYDHYREVWLTDDFSRYWLYDSDVGQPNGTLQQQYEKIKLQVTTSHPQQYGDLRISQLPISQFRGSKVPTYKRKDLTSCFDKVSSVDVPIETVRRNIARASSPEEKEKLQKELTKMLQAREYLNRTVRAIIRDVCSHGSCQFNEDLKFTKELDITNHDCVEQSIRTFSEHCFNLSQHTYALQFLTPIVNIVESMDKKNLGGQCKTFKENLRKVCQKRVANNAYTTIV